MDNNQEIKDIKGNSVKDKDNLSTVLLNNHNVSRAILSKTEKLVAAIHLVTGLMDEMESIRHKLRTLCVETLDDLYSIGRWTSVHDNGKVSDNILKRISHIGSLLDVGLQGGLISSMNHKILKEEYSKFKDALVRLDITHGVQSFSLSGDFFGGGLDQLKRFSYESALSQAPSLFSDTKTESIKDTAGMSDKMSFSQRNSLSKVKAAVYKGQLKKTIFPAPVARVIGEFKSKRKEIILSVIRDETS